MKEFLEHPRNRNEFLVADNSGPGFDSVRLIGPSPVMLARYKTIAEANTTRNLPRIGDDLWRAFDNNDTFFNDHVRRSKIYQMREFQWENHFHPSKVGSPLSNIQLEMARDIFDFAFNKCTRLSISIGYVVARGLSAQDIKYEIDRHVQAGGDSQTRLFLFKDPIDHGRIYSETYATVWGPGQSGERALDALARVIRALDAGQIMSGGKKLSVYCVGYGPVSLSVTRSILEYMWIQETNAPVPTALSPPPSPATAHVVTADARDNIATPVVANLPAAPTLPPATTKLWPKEYTYLALYNVVIDPTHVYMVDAIQQLRKREQQLRDNCATMRALPVEDRDMYDDRKGLEWIAQEEFTIGSGFEATIFMGLYTDPSQTALEADDDASNPTGARAEPKKMLVAVKQSKDGSSPFNAQEQEHYMSLGKQPGVAQYHTGFLLKNGTFKMNILVQEIGLASLRKLIEGDYLTKVAGVVLTTEEKFKLTKALCMAVQELHSLSPSVIHRDLRPENVLLMPNGTLAITDFGLARKAPHKFKGFSVHTKNILTTMQPYEVQERFTENLSALNDIPVTHSGDVFMLGSVIAYIHLGFDPFENDQAIMRRQDPNLGTTLQIEQPWLHHLLTCMLQHDVGKRPSMEFVLKHPYFLSQSQNLSVYLISRVEHIIVADLKPLDNEIFGAIEQLLLPIEVEMASTASKWHEQLPAYLFEGPSKLPVREFAFSKVGTNASRAYPLPQLAQLVKWMRNVLTHFPADPAQQLNLRRCKGALTSDGSCYDTAGEFFLLHPAVSWLLPRMWECSMQRAQELDREKHYLKEQHDLVMEQFETKTQNVEDARNALNAMLA